MNRARRRVCFHILLGVGLLGCVILAQANEWPIEQQNNHRTALVTGVGDMTEPAVRARAYLGGTLDALSVLVGDPNNDGESEIVMVAGGKVFLKDLSDRVLWDTYSIQASGIFGAYDFDGDGSSELLILGSDGLYILRGWDGEVLWHITDFKEGANRTEVGSTRVADINGDTLPDIVTKAFWDSDGLVHAYGFAEGFHADNPAQNQLWQHDIEPSYDQGYFPAIGDLDDNDVPEVVNLTSSYLEAFPANTGGKSTYKINVVHSVYFGRTEILNIDDDPQNELIHFTAQSGKSIEVFDLVGKKDGPVAELVFGGDDQVTAPTYAVKDIDQDGIFEIAYNRYDGSSWVGTIIQLIEVSKNPLVETFSVAAQFQDQQVKDLVDLDGDGRPEILTRATTPDTPVLKTFSTLSAYTFDGSAALLWQYDHAAFHMRDDRGLASLNPAKTDGVVAHQDVDSDGKEELYLSLDANRNQVADALVILNGEDSTPDEAARRSVDEESDLAIIWVGRNVSSSKAGAEVVAIDFDGLLWVFGPTLEADGPGPLKVGGFYSYPAQSVDLDGDEANELIIRKSRGRLSVVDAPSLDQTGDIDATLWNYDGNTSKQYALAFDRDGDGTKEVVVRNNWETTEPALELLNQSGLPVAEVVLDALPFNLLPGDFYGSSAIDLFGIQKTPDNVIELFVIDGATWTIAWKVPAPYQPPTWGAEDSTASAVDLNGDGKQDIAFGEYTNFCVADGKTGGSLGCAEARLYGGSVITGTIDGDSAPDLVLVPSDHLMMLDQDLNTVWSVDFADIDRLNRNAAVLNADGDGLEEIYVAAGNSLYCFDAAGSTVWMVSLVGGSTGADDVSISLSGVAAGDLDGDTAYELVVGSSDGFLYGLDALTGDLEWDFELFYDVGRPIMADIDGDTLLDLAVPVGDGHLYIFTQAQLEKPAEVRDVAVKADLTLDNPDTDVEVTEVAMRLGAAWDPVNGADGYLYAVLSDHNTYVVDWTDVGNVTSVVVKDSRLVYGHTYYVLVQAYRSDRDGSPWARSDGVRITDQSPPTITEVEAIPNPFNPDYTSTSLEAQLNDLTGLSEYTIEVLDGNVTLFYDQYAAGGTSMRVKVLWDGKDPQGTRVDDGTYVFEFTTTDVAAHTSKAQGTVEVVSDTPAPGDDDTSAGDDDATEGDDDATQGDDDVSQTGDDDTAPGDDDVSQTGDDDTTPGDDDVSQTGDDDTTPGDDDVTSAGDDDVSPGDDDVTASGDDDSPMDIDESATPAEDPGSCDCATTGMAKGPGSMPFPIRPAYFGLAVLPFAFVVRRRRKV